MKTIIFVPIKDYFGSRRKLYRKFLFPLITAFAALMITLLFNIGDSAQILQTFNGFVDTQISIVAILISFSVAIITILVSADNKNIDSLKSTTSNDKDYKAINNKQLTLFQVLLSNIAYNTIVEVAYLIVLIGVGLLYTILPIQMLKYILAICVFFIVHIFLVLLESVAQMYLTFWSKK